MAQRTFKFGKFAKRKNSTLRPTNAQLNSFVDISVLFKNPSSLDNPTLTLKYTTSDDFEYNYAVYTNDNGITNYYFVRDKICRNNDLWEVSLTLDSLATHKSEVLATTAYILYDANSNTQIPDNRLPMKTSKTISSSSVDCPFVPDGGCFILSLTGAHNSTGVYKVDSLELAALIDDLNDVTDNIFDFTIDNPPTTPTAPSGSTNVYEWVEYVGDMVEYAALMLKYWFHIGVTPVSQIFGSGNIPENIRECRFIPFNRGTTGGPIPIYLGTFKTKSSLGKLATETVVEAVSVTIPWQATDYRRRSPYTELYIYLPYIGMIRLSPENLIGQNSINVQYALGMRDGSFICTLRTGSGDNTEVIGQYSANVAASVPVGFSNINIPRAAQSVIAAAANIASKNVSGVGMAALNFADSITPNYSSVGGLDGVAAIATLQKITCYSIFHDTIAAPNLDLATIGAPTMCSQLISSLPNGFIQCNEAHVSADADIAILDELDSFLNSGFYKE